MAKEKRQHKIAAAILAVTNAIRAEVDPLLSAEEKAVVVNGAMDIVDNSGVLTIAENADDAVETQHQVDEILEQGGIDRVQENRNNAISGAIIAVETKQAADGDADQDAIEEEIEAMQEEEQDRESPVGGPPAE